jgi:hypothetical protein
MVYITVPALAPSELTTDTVKVVEPPTLPEPPKITAPIANAGDGQQGQIGVPMLLNGSASQSGDGEAISYAWRLTQIPEGSKAILQNADSIKPQFMPDKPGKYQAELFVTDKHNSSLPAMVDITVPALAVSNTTAVVPHHISEAKKNSHSNPASHDDANLYGQELPYQNERDKSNRNAYPNPGRNVMPHITPYGFDAK